MISSYNLHCTSVCQTESKSWQENKTWADFLCPNSHQISWSLINNVFGIKLRLHKKNNLWSLQGYNHIIHKCQSSHTARSCNTQQNTRPIYFSWIIWLFYQQRSRSVRSCTVQSDIHVWIRKVISYNLLVSCSSHCSNDLLGCWHYMNTQTVRLDSEFSWVQLCFVWPTDQTIWGTSIFNIVLT